MVKGTVCSDDLFYRVMDTNQVGVVSELEVMTYISKKGCVVSVPFGDTQRYDQIWDYKGKLYKVQIKTARIKQKNGNRKNAIMFNCFSVSNGKKHRYTKSDIDFYATVWNGIVYLVPVEECSTEKTLWFDENVSKGCCKAVDYEAFFVLERTSTIEANR